MVEKEIRSVLSRSEEETAAVGAWLAERIRAVMTGTSQIDDCIADEARLFRAAGDGTAFVALCGDLGAGKTVFVRGMASVLTPEADVHSPSYNIVNEYDGAIKLCHFDMYRITGEDDLFSVGFYDYFDAVLAVEWSEKIEYALPRVYWRVTIEQEPDGTRHIKTEFIENV